jgi:hypothetical protein
LRRCSCFDPIGVKPGDQAGFRGRIDAGGLLLDHLDDLGEQLGVDGLMGPAEAVAQRLHYSELSHLAVINAAGIADLRRVQRLTAWANRHREDLKQRDALALIDWIRTCPEAAGEKPRWTFSESSQWQALVHELRTAFASPS